MVKEIRKKGTIAHHKVCAGSNLFAHEGPLEVQASPANVAQRLNIDL